MADLTPLEAIRRAKAGGKPKAKPAKKGMTALEAIRATKAETAAKPPPFNPREHFTPYDGDLKTRNTDAGFIRDTLGSIADRWNLETGPVGAFGAGAFDMNAITMGAGEKVKAAAKTPFNDFTYKENVAIEQAKEADRVKKYPVMTYAGMGAGTLGSLLGFRGKGGAPKFGIRKRDKALRGAKVGAGYGAAAGFANSDDVAAGKGFEGADSVAGAAKDTLGGAALGAATGGVLEGAVIPGAQYVGRLFGANSNQPTTKQVTGASASLKDFLIQRPKALRGQPDTPKTDHRTRHVDRELIAKMAEQTRDTVSGRLSHFKNPNSSTIADTGAGYVVPGLFADDFSHGLAGASSQLKNRNKIATDASIRTDLADKRKHYLNEHNRVKDSTPEELLAKQDAHEGYMLSRLEDLEANRGGPGGVPKGKAEWEGLLDLPKVKAEDARRLTDTFDKLGIKGKAADDFIDKFNDSDHAQRFRMVRSAAFKKLTKKEKDDLLTSMARGRYLAYNQKVGKDSAALLANLDKPPKPLTLGGKPVDVRHTARADIAFNEQANQDASQWVADLALIGGRSPWARFGRNLAAAESSWKQSIDRALLDDVFRRNTLSEVARFNREGARLTPAPALSGILAGKNFAQIPDDRQRGPR